MELRRYIKKICGTELGLKTDATKETSKEIVIGNTNRTNKIKGFDDLNEGGYILASEGSKLFINGKGNGVLYGVYGFLEKYTGCRFLDNETEILPSYENLDIKLEISDKFEPVFKTRDLYWLKPDDSDWSIKQGLNSTIIRSLKDVKGDGIDIENYLGDSLAEYLPGESPCLSDPVSIEQVSEKLLTMRRRKYSLKYINLSHIAYAQPCDCERCTAINNEEGTSSGTLMRFINKVAENIAAEYPEVEIGHTVYLNTINVPKVTKPAGNVRIEFHSDMCSAHASGDSSCETNAKYLKDLKAWCDVSKNVYILDTSMDYNYFPATFPNFASLCKNFNIYAELGVKGIYSQGNTKLSRFEFGKLRSYIMAKLLWNPQMTEKEYNTHIDEFLEGYYGKGYKKVREYIDLFEKEAKGHFTTSSIPGEIIPIYKTNGKYDLSFAKNAMALWEAASLSTDGEIILDNLIKNDSLLARHILEKATAGTEIPSSIFYSQTQFNEWLFAAIEDGDEHIVTSEMLGK